MSSSWSTHLALSLIHIYTRDGNVYTGVVLNTEPSAHVADEPVKTIEKNMEILLDENVESKDCLLYTSRCV